MTKTTMNKTLKTTIAATTIALIGAIGITAGAEAFGGKHREGGRGGMGGFAHEMMQGIDQNSDGTVTEAEAEAQLLNIFAMVDGDSNGAVSMDELKAAHEAKREARSADRDGKHGDKAEKHGKRHADRGDKDGKDGKRGKRGERGMQRMFDRFDADSDGSVTQAEFKTAIADYTDNIASRANKGLERQAAKFADMDINSDGQISKEEYQAARKGGRGNR